MADLLIIDGKVVDLSPSTQVALSSASNDLAELKDRQGGFSNSIKLPPTKNNDEIFAFSKFVTSGSSKPYAKLSCKYYSDGIEVVGGSGFCIATSAGTDGYNINIYSGNTLFFDAIEGKKLSDLDTTLYDIYWNHSNIVAMYGNTASPSVAIVDDGNVSESVREINSKTMFPHLFARDIVEMIFSQAGFTITGDILTHPDYTGMMIPFTNDKPKQGIQEQDKAHSKAVRTTDAYGPAGVGDITIILQDDSVDGFDTNNNYNATTGEYTVADAGIINVKGHIVVGCIQTVVLPIGAFIGYVKVFKNGVLQYTSPGISNTNININDNNYIDFEAAVSCVAGDVITTKLQYTQIPVGANPYSISLGILEGGTSTNGKTNIEFTLADELLWKGMWRFNVNLPSMSQKDFIKSIMQLFFLSCDMDSKSKEVLFYSMDDVNDFRSLGEDWSDYIDDRSVSIEFHSSNYGQENVLKYADDDQVTDQLGDGSFTIYDDSLAIKKDLFTLPFAASETVIRMRGLEMGQVRVIDADGKDVTPKPRILRFTNNAFPSPNTNDYIRIYEDGTANANDFFTSYVGIFDYEFNNMIAAHGESTVNLLDQYKRVSVMMKLPASKYSMLKHYVPVYVKKFAGWFYVNKIDGWQSDKLCKCELIRL